MQIDEKTFVVDSIISLTAFCAFVKTLFGKGQYITFTWRLGVERSIDQNSLMHLWLSQYAAHLIGKNYKQVTEEELEGIKKIAKKRYYLHSGASWMVTRPVDPFTKQEGQLMFRSSSYYSVGEMFLFLTWLQLSAADDGIVLESRGQFSKLQREQQGEQ